jgi:5-methylcytosine-specific restriction endonuclease McrA
VKRLRPYEVAPIAAFNAIAAVKEEPSRSALLRLRPLIERLYKRYASNTRRLAIMRPYRPLSAADADALLSCYDGPTKALNDLAVKIREAQPEALRWECQYCGLNESNTWDHYLPKAEFREFAVYPPNLIPCCHNCNIRRKEWADRGALTCVNLYYDPIDPQMPLVEANIRIENGLPKVTFSLRKGRARRLFRRRFARHWVTLDLSRRFGRRAGRILSALEFEIQSRAPRQSLDEIMEDLREIAGRKLQAFGPNHIEAVLYRAAAESRALLQHYRGGSPQPSQPAPAKGSGPAAGGTP